MPFFGKWPNWFNIYLKTCEYNPTINWIFFTDCGKPKNHPKNVSFVEMVLNDFNSLASKKLGLKINLKKPYKLCEFRPAYGIIFEDYIKGYDFLGYGDIDVVYGNIKKFITEKILKDYDIITAKNYLSGHFTLFKNANKTNRLYEKNPDYKRAFNIKGFCGLDENADTLFGRIYKIESMTKCAKRFARKKQIKIFFKKMLKEDYHKGNKNKWHMYWNKGKLINLNRKKEFLYFHFVNSKFKTNFLIPKKEKVPDKFFINKNGFYYNKEITGIERSVKTIKKTFEIKRIYSFIGKYILFRISDYIKELICFINKKLGQFGIFLNKNFPSFYKFLKKSSS